MISELDTNFLARMELVLATYERPFSQEHPVVCLDERPGQLLEDVKAPLPVGPERPQKRDYEYKRCGTYVATVMVEPLAGWRHVDVRANKKDEDFAHHLVYLADHVYPDVPKITLVVDNLSTHRLETLWKILPASEALRLATKFELVWTPVHGSWLNMAELELSAFVRQCLGKKRFATLEELGSFAKAWEDKRNQRRTTIEWSFTPPKAREKFRRFYPKN